MLSQDPQAKYDSLVAGVSGLCRTLRQGSDDFVRVAVTGSADRPVASRHRIVVVKAVAPVIRLAWEQSRCQRSSFVESTTWNWRRPSVWRKTSPRSCETITAGRSIGRATILTSNESAHPGRWRGGRAH